MTFLTKATNLEVTNRDPAEYIPAYEEKHPGVVASHWIPMDPELWRVENYPAFLDARRKLLAAAANAFLEELAGGAGPDVEVGGPVVGAEGRPVIVDLGEDDEATTIAECRAWVSDRGLPSGSENYELIDETTGEQVAVLDLAWPEGLQEGLTQPVALLLNEGAEIEAAAREAGFRFFTSAEAFTRYVETEVLGEEGAA